MFLTLNHQKLDLYVISIELVSECYKLTRSMPVEEKFGMISQIRRASLSVHLNISEGSSRHSQVERRRFFEIARGSLIEIDAALDVANMLGYLVNVQIDKLGGLIIQSFKILTALMKK
ncbi:MAG: four helix bundle protein [Chitinophagaceae bacterium]